MSDNQIRKHFKRLGLTGITTLKPNGYAVVSRTPIGRARTSCSSQNHFATVNKLERNRANAKRQRLARRITRRA